MKQQPNTQSITIDIRGNLFGSYPSSNTYFLEITQNAVTSSSDCSGLGLGQSKMILTFNLPELVMNGDFIKRLIVSGFCLSDLIQNKKGVAIVGIYFGLICIF